MNKSKRLKFPLALLSFCFLFSLSPYAQCAGLNYHIKNEHAQELYETLSGVPQEGAAGHIFRKGKNVLCWRTNADMDDEQGKPIPVEDPRRYGCSIHFDSAGVATPGSPF